MFRNESLPVDSFDDESQSYLNWLENQMRSDTEIYEYESQIRTEMPDLYKLMAESASERAPFDPKLHAFYFSEFTLLIKSFDKFTRSLYSNENNLLTE